MSCSGLDEGELLGLRDADWVERRIGRTTAVYATFAVTAITALDSVVVPVAGEIHGIVRDVLRARTATARTDHESLVVTLATLHIYLLSESLFQ